MIFVDSNIPMYLVGAEHPNKVRARELVKVAISDEQRLITDAEVLQEILHRYVAIGRRDAIQPAFDAVLGLVDEVIPVELGAVERAKTILASVRGISARDAIHIATMERRGIRSIMTFDRGFDVYPHVERVGG